MDIFNPQNQMTSQPFYFKNEGDQVQGTYIGKTMGVMNNFNTLVNKYELLTNEGVRFVEFSVTKPINTDMGRITFGQIVGFKFTGKGKARNGSEFKVIEVFSNPSSKDQDWINNNPSLAKGEGNVQIGGVDVPMQNTPAQAPTYQQAAYQQAAPQGGHQSIDAFQAAMGPAPTESFNSGQVAQPTVSVAPSAPVNAIDYPDQTKYQDVPFYSSSDNTQEVEKAIYKVIQERFGIFEPSEVQARAIMETQMAFIPENFVAIHDKLTMPRD